MVGNTTKAVKKQHRAYVGFGVDLSFLNWHNEYTGLNGADLGSDSFHFKPLIGMHGTVGYRPADRWRTDLEFGYIGKYSESETEYYSDSPTEKTVFDMINYDITVNGYYNFWRGMYAGIGTGAAIIKTSLDNTNYYKTSSTDVSLMGALMLGWSTKVEDRVDLDLRYRVALFDGGSVTVADVKTDEKMVTDMSFSVGVRYNF